MLAFSETILSCDCDFAALTGISASRLNGTKILFHGPAVVVAAVLSLTAAARLSGSERLWQQVRVPRSAPLRLPARRRPRTWALRRAKGTPQTLQR